MKRESTGTYVSTKTAGEVVRAFVPDPLPPHPPLDLGGTRAALLEGAQVACGRLDGFSSILPNPELFLYSYVRREAVLSSQIEGTQSSLSDLLLFEAEEVPGVPLDDVIEVSNYVRALEHGIERIGQGFPLSNRLIREIHAILLESGRGAERQPGEFRRSQNWIGGTRPGNAHFVPPPPDEVGPCMSKWEAFLHAHDDGLPTLVRAGLAHVQFETIHPFLDGNGRTGRLLITLMLFERGILKQPLLYLSLHFKRHRDEYYRLLDAVRLTGDWEGWIEFFLEGVVNIAGQAVETAGRLVRLFEDDAVRVQAMGRSASSAFRVLKALESRPVASINTLAKRSAMSYDTASRSVSLLQKLGILSEITGQKRERVFAYDGYLRILDAGARGS